MKKTKDNMRSISSDIISILKISETVGWNDLSSMSIIRILYFSTLFYSFTHQKDNPFNREYNFIVTIRGPISNDVSNSLASLESDEKIKCKNLQYSLINENIPSNLAEMPNYTKKNDWFMTVINILALYGENKIYDLIFRDPEYKDKRDRNIKDITTNDSNESLLFLNKFKKLFEETIDKEYASQLTPEKYLELYFDYIFSKVIKGEA